jgi:hypothetical protein
MKISEKRHSDLYSSIHNPIMDIRLSIRLGESSKDIDRLLFELETKIYEKVSEALSISKS